MANNKSDNGTNNNSNKKKKTTTSLPSSYTTERKPNLKELKYEFKVNEFAMRGLNKYRNFLTPPISKETNKPVPFTLESDKELETLCSSLLINNNNLFSAIFLVYRDGKQRMIFTIPEYDEEEDMEYISGIGSAYVDEADGFAKFDADCILHCYGLMIEKEKGQWMIQD